MAKKLKTTNQQEGPLHRKWRQDVEAEIEEALDILHHRRSKHKVNLKALAASLGITPDYMGKVVTTMKVTFLIAHQRELYKASEYTGMDLEDLILDAVRQYMVQLQRTVQKNPFLGSPLHQKHVIAKKAELYQHREATDTNKPDYAT